MCGTHELMDAAQRGDLQKMQDLIDGGENVNAMCEANGMTAVARAACHGNLISLQFLHGKGARMTTREFSLGFDILMMSVCKGQNHIVEWLLSIDFDTQHQSDDGDTALDIAVRTENARAVDLLCDHIKRRYGMAAGRSAVVPQ